MNIDLLRLRVVESSAFIAAPLAGLTLAQFGADVIRVDMIGGGIDYARLPTAPSGRSIYWTSLNRNKRSVAVDLRKPEGQELVRALVCAGDGQGGVLLTNVLSAWLTHADLAQRRADVITCMIEGNPDGTTAMDYTVNCATGFPMMTGNGSAAAPVNHALPAWDIACAYQAALAVVAAASRRERTGAGAELRLSLADAAFSVLSHIGLATEAEVLQQDRPALGNHIYGAFGRDFATRDGRRVMVAAISARQWMSLVAACDAANAVRELERSLNADFRREADRYRGREAIASLLEPWFAARSHEQIRKCLDEHNVCWGDYQTVRELVSRDRRVGVDNPVWERLTTPGVGTHLSAGTPVRAMRELRGQSVAAPYLGQHTDEVLHEVLGLQAAQIGRLHDGGVVAGPEKDPSRAS